MVERARPDPLNHPGSGPIDPDIPGFSRKRESHAMTVTRVAGRGWVPMIFGLAISVGTAAMGQVPAMPPGGGVTYLDQGWSPELRQSFYQTDQGSQLIPYGWFLVLEQAGGTTPFRSAASIGSFGYLPDEGKSPSNPDGLPIGFTKGHDPKTGDWMGFTCAACHTAEITYRGKTIRIDGAPTL